MFNEGVDIPDANLLVFLRSSENSNVFQQQLGRGLRLSPGKDTVRVLDFVANSERIRSIKEFAAQIAESLKGRDRTETGGVDLRDIFNLENNNFEFEELVQKIEKIIGKLQKVANGMSNDRIVELAKTMSPDGPLRSTAIRSLSNEGRFPSTTTIKERFGSMKAFHEACGYEVKDLASLSDAEVIDLAISLSQGKRIREKEMKEWSTDGIFLSTATIFSRFGSLANFNRACGLEAGFKGMEIDEILSLARKIKSDGPILHKDIEELSKQGVFPSAETINTRFGSMRAFHEACGFAARGVPDLTDKELIDLALQLSPDKPLGQRGIKEFSKRREFISGKAIRQRFGSLSAFHELCGFQPRVSVRQTEDHIIGQALEILREDPTIQLDYSTIVRLSKEGKITSHSTIYKRFGNLDEFRRQVVIELERQQELVNDKAGESQGDEEANTADISLEIQDIPEEDINPEIVLLDQADVRKVWNRLPRMRTNPKPDYEKRREENVEIGLRGEKIVMDIERKRLIDAGRSDLAEKVWQASLVDDSLGFDILSFEADGQKKHIEVKATRNRRSSRLKFFLSENERRAAEFFENYHIYYVEDAGSARPRVTQIQGTLDEDRFSVSPMNYMIEGIRS